MSNVKLPVHRAGLPGHASGEQNVSKGNTGLIVPLDPRLRGRACGAPSGQRSKLDSETSSE
jgi:hypothetical protein